MPGAGELHYVVGVNDRVVPGVPLAIDLWAIVSFHRASPCTS